MTLKTKATKPAEAKTVHPVEDIENFNWHPRAGEYDRYMQQLTEEGAIEAKAPFVLNSKRTGCKFCGKEGLHWNKVKGHWALVDMLGHVHNCRPSASTELGDDTPF